MNDESLPLGDRVKGLVSLPGAPDRGLLGEPLYDHLLRTGALTWAALARMTESELIVIRNIGPTRIRKLLEELEIAVRVRSAFGDPDDPSTALPSPQNWSESATLGALTRLASWGVGTGTNGSLLDVLRKALTASGAMSPSAELEVLGNVRAADLADPAVVATYDPLVAAERLLATFDQRQRATLDRLLDIDGSSSTLEAIGERFGVTRERIRQIEGEVERSLASALAGSDSRALAIAADALRNRLGVAVPAQDLAAEFATNPPDHLDRLILHLAGPFRLVGSWFVLRSLGSIDQVVESVFDSLEIDGRVPHEMLLNELVDQGILERYADQLIKETQWFKIMGADVVDWRGSLADKSVRVLAANGAPMTLSEIGGIVEPNSTRGMSNQIQADSRVRRVGVKRYGLVRWGGAEYPGIDEAMSVRLKDGPRPIDELARELQTEFGVSLNSVSMKSGTNPRFIAESGWVRLRAADEPYVPKSDLSSAPDCFVVDGCWAWRLPVDKDTLRGSGRKMTEAFAIHLGLDPLSSCHVDSPHGPINLTWPTQPTIGSLRSAAADLTAEDGDWMFVRRIAPTRVDIRIVRFSELPEASEPRLRALIGAADSTASIERVIAEALGLGDDADHDIVDLRDRLSRRREKDLVELVDLIDRGDGQLIRD